MIKMYKPTLDDLWFRERLMSDPDTMSYNNAWGGTIPFPKEEWNEWYQDWLQNSSGSKFYRYLQLETTEEFVGEIAYHFDARRDIYIADIIVLAEYRGRGYGSEGILLLCNAAKENGITILHDDIAAGNPSVSLFLKNGFSVDYQTSEIVMVKKKL